MRERKRNFPPLKGILKARKFRECGLVSKEQVNHFKRRLCLQENWSVLCAMVDDIDQDERHLLMF